MVAMRTVLLLLGVAIAANGENSIFKNDHLNVFKSGETTVWTVANKNGKVGMKGLLSAGSTIPANDCIASEVAFCRQDSGKKVEMKLVDSCVHISTESQDPTGELRDCIDLEDAHWFGGPEQYNQFWPVEKLSFSDYSYVTKEDNNMAVVERYWLNSNGIYVYVDSEVPLFVDQHNYRNNSLCFIARNKDPYLESRQSLTLKYSVCGLTQGNAKEAHYDAIERFLHKPTGVPDERMIRHPIWSTWARYKGQISEKKVLEFANQIVDNGFNNSQLEIDDNWETCYGSLIVDTGASKFPDMRQLSLTLKSMGFRVTLWIHPFINTNCEPYHSFALTKNYLVKNLEGSLETSWWRGKGALVDFTNPEAVEWWVGNLNLLVENELIDSFKFDAGESSWAPQIPSVAGSPEDQPENLSVNYAETCARFGSFVEVRVGHKTQHLPIFVRMLDKDSRWGYNNGLKTLVTTLLQMNMVGYPFSLPDMIGGNGYLEKPTKELYIRWLQANTFMPSLQFSYVPWDFDNETVEISLKFAALHDRYTDLIMVLAQKAVEDGTPINAPIWWLDPEDTTAQAIDDEFLLGENVLIAPVLEKDAFERDIYLPIGEWLDANTMEIISGPKWIMGYSAPLDLLPYFTRVE